MTFEQAVQNAFWNIRLSDTIIRSIAIVTFVLALIGLYAVTGHTVERWTKELGLRIALGAQRPVRSCWLVIRRVLTQLSVGLAARPRRRAGVRSAVQRSGTEAATGVQMMDARRAARDRALDRGGRRRRLPRPDSPRDARRSARRVALE